MSINITPDNGSLTMKGSGKVRINTAIKIYGTNTELPITIQADFNKVPPHLHQLYMQSMIGSYGRVNAYDNTKDEEPKTIAEQKSEWRINRIVDIICKAINK